MGRIVGILLTITDGLHVSKALPVAPSPPYILQALNEPPSPRWQTVD